MPESIQWLDGVVDDRRLGLCVIADGKRYHLPDRLSEGVERGDRVQFTCRPGRCKSHLPVVDKLLHRP